MLTQTYFRLILFCGFVLLLCSAAEIFEFEDALNSTQQEYLAWRSDASNNKTLRVVDVTADRLRVQLTLCVRPHMKHRNVSVQISNVRYSNDGPKDNVVFRLEGNYLVHFLSEEVWGKGFGWNMFKNTGVLGEKVYLKKGQYELSVDALTDVHGLELDTLAIETQNQHPYLGLICKKAFTRK